MTIAILDQREERQNAVTIAAKLVESIRITSDKRVVITPVIVKPTRTSFSDRAKDKLRNLFSAFEKKKDEQRKAVYTTAVIPAHNEQDDIAHTLRSLVEQVDDEGFNPIDRVVVIINGSTDGTLDIVKMFADAFPERISYVNNPNYVTKSGRIVEVDSKVAALNYAWRTYIDNTQDHRGSEEYILGLDADVVLKPNAVSELRKTLLDDMDRPTIGGVRAVYGFTQPEHAGWRERSLIAAQQLDFAGTELKDQLRRNGKVTILGGQATLFRRSALARVSETNNGFGPWNDASLVEDAYLTRQLEAINMHGTVNRKAHATVGAMSNARAWWAQRRKWQNGHILDIASEKHFALDRVRWAQQFALGFNLVLRLLFVALLVTSLREGTFEFSWLWLIPLGLAALQGMLVASRMHTRNGWLVLRAATYILPEIYVWKTLAVWLMSLRKASLAFVNSGKSGQDDWKRQASAEKDGRTGSWAMWSTIFLAASLPTVGLMAFCYAMPSMTEVTLNYGWMILAIMSVISSAFMVVKILRILKNFSRLSL